MNRAWLKYGTLVVAALLVLTFLYVRTQSVDLDQHNRLFHSISEFKQVDTRFNQHVLEVRQGLLAYYDSIEDSLAELRRLLDEIERTLSLLYRQRPVLIEQALVRLEQELERKRELVEEFKSGNAVLRNSQRYLPVAVSRFLARLPDDAAGIRARQAMHNMLHDVMAYNLTSDPVYKQRLETVKGELRGLFEQAFPDRLGDLDILLSHARLAQTSKDRTDASVQNLLEQPTIQALDELLDNYVRDHSRMIERDNRYWLALYAFAVLLLFYIGYILYRLNRTTRQLRRTVADLNYQKFALDQHAIVSIADRSGKIIYANQKFCDISGRSMAELIGQDHRIAKSEHHPDAFFEEMWQTITSGQVWHGQIMNRARDGHHYWVDTTIVPFMDEAGEPYQYVAIRTDITAIKQAEEELRNSRQRLAEAQRLAHIGSWELDLRSKRLTWSDEVFRIFEIDPDEFSASYEVFMDVVHPDDREKVDQAYRFSLENRVPYAIEHRLRMADGRVKHVVERGQTYYDEHDRPTHSLGTVQDVTERHQTEEALRRAQKMEAIGRISGGIAHDFNNQLGVIIGYLDFLRGFTEGNEKASRWVDIASRATLRCMDLTRQLLAFSRHQGREKAVVDINNLITEMESMITRSVTPEVEVRYFLAEGLWLTEIDPGEFQDVILNLVINARDAMPTGGRLLIETINKTVDDTYASRNPGMEAGEYVQLMLSDTGTGMDQETLDRLFEPFFTTKPAGKGTGLGMAMVYGFVKRYGGHIKVYSEPGMGTTIRLYLPRSGAARPDRPIPDTNEQALPCGTETVLVVDDEEDLVTLAEQHLADLGYRTYSASNAAQALAILEREEGIDLLFSDVVMPGGMNGYELARQAVRLQPGIRVLLTSGFTRNTLENNGLAKFANHMLHKPYRQADLARRVRLVLDGEEEA